MIEIATPPKYSPARGMAPRSVTVHNTANKHAGAVQHARAQAAGNLDGIAVHYYVDDASVVRCLPHDRQGWHAGDGAVAGGGNATSISIEVCEQLGINQRRAFENAAGLAADICRQYGWGLDRVKLHQDWKSSKYPRGKYCPHILLDGVEGMTVDWFLGLVGARLQVGGAQVRTPA